LQRESLYKADYNARDIALKGKVARRGDNLYLKN